MAIYRSIESTSPRALTNYAGWDMGDCTIMAAQGEKSG